MLDGRMTEDYEGEGKGVDRNGERTIRETYGEYEMRIDEMKGREWEIKQEKDETKRKLPSLNNI